MENGNIERKIRLAFAHGTPNVLDSIISDCREQKETVMIAQKRKVNWARRITAAAAALVLIVGLGAGVGFYRVERTVAATVSLDVNPSVELTVNRKNRILTVGANNEDGNKIIGDMDLTGSTLDVAVNALIGAMVRNGYLSELANSVLVSVDSTDAAVGTALQEKLAQEISVLLDGDGFSGAVISQTVIQNDALSSLARENQISVGKANLIQQIIDQDSRYTFEELADRSINELKLISESPSIQLENASTVGNASEKGYIGRDAAMQMALNQLKATVENVSGETIELEFEDGMMVYEIAFLYKGIQYEFVMDAKNGVTFIQSYDPKDPDSSGYTADYKVSIMQYTGADPILESAFAHAGVNASDVQNLKRELSSALGYTSYDVEFTFNGYEYEYEIDVATATVLQFRKEPVVAENPEDDAYIGSIKAQEIALEYAKLTLADVRDLEWKLDREQDAVYYYIKYVFNGMEQCYKIHGLTGEIIFKQYSTLG